MKVYVDELPKKCEYCPCCSGDQYCNYSWENYTDTEKPHFDECNLKDYCKIPYDFNNNMTKYKEWLDNLPKNNDEQHKTCPLQSLSYYNKQVRKEVCEEIREKAYNLFCDDTIGWLTREEMFLEYLDQIQGEGNVKN